MSKILKGPPKIIYASEMTWYYFIKLYKIKDVFVPEGMDRFSWSFKK